MNNFSYTKSQTLIDQVHKIDELRNKNLLTLLPPAVELQLQWKAMKERYRYTVLPYGLVPSEKSLENLFVVNQGKKESDAVVLVRRYKKIHDYILQNWPLHKAHLKADDVDHILKLSQFHARIDLNSLSRYLQYVQINPEHPVIQAALIHILFLSLVSVNEESKTIARHLSMLLLVKYGYDIKQLVVLEKIFVNNAEKMNEIIIKYSRSQNATEWIEYFIEKYYVQLEEIEKQMQQVDESKLLSSFAQLSQRQKEILSLIDKPEMKITNKVVQKTFGISQITASRDLTKLAELGLLFAGGKGRSVYYTKV